MAYQALAVTSTFAAAGTERVRVLLRPSPRPDHQAFVPSGGVVYAVLICLSGRLTFTAWSPSLVFDFGSS